MYCVFYRLLPTIHRHDPYTDWRLACRCYSYKEAHDYITVGYAHSYTPRDDPNNPSVRYIIGVVRYPYDLSHGTVVIP
jgi:hypothetical protein